MEEDSKLKETRGQGVSLPVLDDKIRQNFNLVIYHDGLDVTTIYVNNVLQRFKQYFGKVYLVLEDEINLNDLDECDNLMVVRSIKPINLGAEWVLILEPGEFPSIQMLNSFEKILSEIDNKIKIIRFPLVICDFKTGEIIDIRPPVARLFRQNPQILQNNDASGEKTLEEYPLIKLYVDFEELEAKSEKNV